MGLPPIKIHARRRQGLGVFAQCSYASRLRIEPEVELESELELFRLDNHCEIALEDDELLELEVSELAICVRQLAPLELDDEDASCVSPVLAAVLSPKEIACTMARISAALSVAVELVFEVAPVLVLDAVAFDAVELSDSMSVSDAVRSPSFRSVPSWLSSLATNVAARRSSDVGQLAAGNATVGGRRRRSGGAVGGVASKGDEVLLRCGQTAVLKVLRQLVQVGGKVVRSRRRTQDCREKTARDSACRHRSPLSRRTAFNEPVQLAYRQNRGGALEASSPIRRGVRR